MHDSHSGGEARRVIIVWKLLTTSIKTFIDQRKRKKLLLPRHFRVIDRCTSFRGNVFTTYAPTRDQFRSASRGLGEDDC
jgi:hypothetical protein